jgi:hypothetical protein
VHTTENLQDHQEYDTSIHDGLGKLLEVSTYLSFPFTLQEAADYFLPKSNLTTGQLKTLLASNEFADLNFIIKDGYLLTGNEQAIAYRSERERISAAKLDSATSFAELLVRTCPFIRTVAVTGSVAYGSADKWDDIDLFVITERGRLWVSTILMLIQVRLYKLLRMRPAHLLPFCLSYIHDQDGFLYESRRNKTNPLFARELLKAKPVAGIDEYRRVLSENRWVREYYSGPYWAKLNQLEGEEETGQKERRNWPVPAILALWADRIAYEMMSRYLRLRAYLANLKIRARGEDLRAFDPVISYSSCVYTSNFYRWLRALWGE